MAYDSWEKLPIYKKAVEIAEITKAITDAIDEEKDELALKSLMLENAYILGAKIAGAEGGELYSIKMENAVIIKKAACDLQAQSASLKAEKIVPVEYVKLLRDEIDNFRILFIEWINSFERNDDDYDDGWDLFNGTR